MKFGGGYLMGAILKKERGRPAPPALPTGSS